MRRRRAERTDLKEARECFEKALKLNPNLDQTRQALELLNSGAIGPSPALLMQQGRIAEAKRLLIDQTSAEAGSTNAWHNLGLIYLDEKNFGEAKRCFANVLRSNLKVTGSNVENPWQPRLARLKTIFEVKMK